jgi:hypothetical protein
MAPTTSPTPLVEVVDELVSRAAFQRPDLSTAFDDDGWVPIRLTDVLINRAGLAFAADEVAIARPAVARHASDFIAFSERLGSLVGLRHQDHFLFLDEDRAGAMA